MAVSCVPHCIAYAHAAKGKRVTGFTLLEILVVMMMMGLLAGMVLPRIQNIFTTYELSGQRKGLTITLHGLGYQAYTLGRELRLEGGHLTSGQENMDSLLAMPAGWKIRTNTPIIYAANGICNGGGLDLVDPLGGIEQYQLRSPLCRLERMEAAE